MNGYARYEKLMAEWASFKIEPFYRAHQIKQKLPPIDAFFEKTFKGFNEISNTLNALRLTGK